MGQLPGQQRGVGQVLYLPDNGGVTEWDGVDQAWSGQGEGWRTGWFPYLHGLKEGPDTRPPNDRMTDTCQNNTFLRTTYVVGNQLVIFHTVMSKAEGQAENWHGHVTALTVAPEFRRLGLAGRLMQSLEEISERYILVSYSQ